VLPSGPLLYVTAAIAVCDRLHTWSPNTLVVLLNMARSEVLPVITRSRPYGICCAECNAALIAPICSEYVSEGHVRHSWWCEDCSHQFVTSDHLQFDRTRLSRSKVQSPASLIA
jgi:hypothetical protein